MIVLGVDPGYKNLGLSVLRIDEEDSSKVELLWSKNMAVGRATAPMAFAKFLVPRLEALHSEYGPIEGVACETPPILPGNIKTTAFLWAVTSIIVGWAQQKDMAMRHASPISLKRGVCRTLDMPWDKSFIPRKSHVKKAVEALLGTTSSTSHENDATFIGLLLFSKAVPAA